VLNCKFEKGEIVKENEIKQPLTIFNDTMEPLVMGYNNLDLQDQRIDRKEFDENKEYKWRPISP